MSVRTDAGPGRSTPPRRRPRARLVLLAAGALTAVSLAVAVPLANGDDETVAPRIDPAQLVPEVEQAAGPELFPVRLTPAPTRGQVQRVAGPFDEGAELTGLRLSGAALTGRAQVLREVSDLLELRLRGGWYDARGTLLGTTDLALTQEDLDRAAGGHAEHDAAHPFRLAVPPALAPRVTAVSVYVAQLVVE